MRNASIENLGEGRLLGFYSQVERLTAARQEDALAFHRVVSAIFRQTAVIPIRFPTLLQGEPELRDFLREQEPKYAAALERLCDSIQIELSISVVQAAAPAPVESGRRYLEERRALSQNLAAISEQVRARVQHLVTGWRTRDGSQRDSVRCYALIARSAEKAFRDQIQSMTIPEFSKMTLSGPWPCTEFLE